MSIEFTPPRATEQHAQHHKAAAAANIAAAQAAKSRLSAALSNAEEWDRILLRAAAGAGKSYALVDMVRESLTHPSCTRVAVTAFANKQVFPLAADLGKALGARNVCLFVSAAKRPDVPDDVVANVSIATTAKDIPLSVGVVLATSHKFGVFNEASRLLNHLDAAANGATPFDVLFVDEAWQLPLYLYSRVERLAPISVGVGDVGQLPPLDASQNPWRGDPGYNPYRAWPTAYEGTKGTFAIDLPAVWRPTAAQLPLWRAFYSEWDQLDCVAGPGDRTIELPGLSGDAAAVWESVATGVPTMLEVDGLPEPEAADIDVPLLGVVEELLRELLTDGFKTVRATYDGHGQPNGERRVSSDDPGDDPLIVVLATRNQAVDDATEMVDRLIEEFDLPANVVVASTVDSWQGQTNAITIAIHPLSGAEHLDDFNSAFGRLAVTCTRATQGLLMLARNGLDQLLDEAAARPGTPFGEPGPRSLPRQTHQRILNVFCRGTMARPPRTSTDP